MKKGDPFAGLPRPSLYERAVSTSVHKSTKVSTVDKPVDTKPVHKSTPVDKPVDSVDKAVDRHPPPLKYKRAPSAEEKRKAYKREWMRQKRAKKVK